MREVTTSNPAQNTVPCVRLEHSAVFYIVTITGFQTVAKKRLLVSLYPSVRTYQCGFYWTDSVKFDIGDFLKKKETPQEAPDLVPVGPQCLAFTQTLSMFYCRRRDTFGIRAFLTNTRYFYIADSDMQ